ncbi:hypothetical protein Psi02_03730 [Planotetraspora silvatica]|uniref:Uncharacterized protein n=1 Tax=Planotetraspora silvatica TaxID=234614 RepID=A0A8J3UKH4_9ACTN|nr:hypothetical protein [Planotetraspora silvatica]GII43949.1 hypothetical protein Psi02_03730 [Planotetraspora silvatica]
MSMEEANNLVRSWKDPDFRDGAAAHPAGDIDFGIVGGESDTSGPCIGGLTLLASCLPICDGTLWNGTCALSQCKPHIEPIWA